MSEYGTVNIWREEIINFFQNRMNTSALAKAKKFIDERTSKLEAESNDKKRARLESTILKKQSELTELRTNPVEIIDWLDKSSSVKIGSGSRIIKSTHPLKISHSSAPNEGILVDYEDKTPLLTTASIRNINKTYDMAHNNGALISISRFLAITVEGTSIYDLVLADKFHFLEGFSRCKEQLRCWNTGFSQLIEKRAIKSATFTKQSYYPIADQSYHLLSILNSSALAESVFSEIQNSIYTKVNNFFDKEGSMKQRLIFPKNKLAVIRVGGNNPQNVSMLNRGRNWKLYRDSTKSFGIYYSLSTEPPVWHSTVKPPIYKANFFYELSKSYEVQETIQYLADFLTRFESLQLSIKDPKRMRWVEKWIESLADEVLVYVKTIQTLPAGWTATEDIKLKVEHQLLLDCYRDDEVFAELKTAGTWQAVIGQDFSAWLNNQLSKVDDRFTPTDTHSKLWSKLFTANFREELDIKNLTAGAEQ